MKKKKFTHGGARPGAGRPKGEPSTTIAFRVPILQAIHIKEEVKKLIDRIQEKHKKATP